MKIGIFSDTHLGFDEKGERVSESFEMLEQAIGLCIEQGVDAIAVAGDIFDAAVPSHDSLFRAVNSFSSALKGSSPVKIFAGKNGVRTQVHFSGVPVIVIHGNHEFLGRHTRTALDVLNASGHVIYLHAASAAIEKGGERAFLHCLGAVPEKRALEVLRAWGPKPVREACNIMLVHQAFREFMAIDDEMVASLSLDDLPEGFDLVVDGHLHWRSEQKLKGCTFVLAGSTICTSIKKLEAEKPKGVYFFDTASRGLSFVPFHSQRRSFYHRLEFAAAEPVDVLSACRKAVLADLASVQGMKPLVRLNLKGTLKKGLSSSDLDLSGFLAEFSGRAIISASKNFSNLSFRRRISELREMQKSRLSVAAMGMEMLEKNLAETDIGSGFESARLFALLVDDDLDAAMEMFSKP
ncbi:MAG: metallophosphoesterase family protein [Candidatus Diapherotrites archaeon]|uniref:Metallophosphoesterase family protein n=1 Tax=Candidatus Iainarchaeum sp. TaxID=3101447 RepID=A0A8T3YNW7_9ARCH|nr:metallophosphoesterase family protein [Candidatus Diapherotrites archaeon]